MSVNSYLVGLASSAIIRDDEKVGIDRSITNLRKKLSILDEYFSEHFIFGSYSRGTILPRSFDKNSDIDYMIIFNDDSKKPQTYLNWLRENVADKYYSSSEIYQSNPTIVLELNHIKFELVPAIKNQLGQLQIPAKASAYNDWITTDPIGFNSTLTNANQRHKNLIKPLVRLVKYWNAKAGYPFESFDFEQKVVNIPFNSNSQLRDYFYSFANFLTVDYSMAQWKKNEVAIFKKIAEEAKYFESIRLDTQAENQLKQLFV
jgi:predicted nucleotidyltransferase